jgi:hypothetical protein
LRYANSDATSVRSVPARTRRQALTASPAERYASDAPGDEYWTSELLSAYHAHHFDEAVFYKRRTTELEAGCREALWRSAVFAGVRIVGVISCPALLELRAVR